LAINCKWSPTPKEIGDRMLLAVVFNAVDTFQLVHAPHSWLAR
jgi:hypothetical protein